MHTCIAYSFTKCFEVTGSASSESKGDIPSIFPLVLFFLCQAQDMICNDDDNMICISFCQSKQPMVFGVYSYNV